jgi:hypothetical protein
MPIPRTKCLSTKLTDDEYAELEAQVGSQTLSTWARETLLHAARAQPPPRARPLESVVVAEVLALRAILVNLHFAMATGADITVERMQQLIDRADCDKMARAVQQLEAATGDGR